MVHFFAEDVLVPTGGPVVTVQMGGQGFGPCLLDAAEIDGASPWDTTIILRFRRAGRQ